MFSSLEEVSKVFMSTGYIADSIVDDNGLPGSRDSTSRCCWKARPAAEKRNWRMQLRSAANTTVERLQCYEGINEEKAIGKFDEPCKGFALN